jgi:hypothetical protein
MTIRRRGKESRADRELFHISCEFKSSRLTRLLPDESAAPPKIDSCASLLLPRIERGVSLALDQFLGRRSREKRR